MVLGQRDLYAVASGWACRPGRRGSMVFEGNVSVAPLMGVHAMLCGVLVVVDGVTIFGVAVVIPRKGFVVLLENIAARSCEWP